MENKKRLIDANALKVKAFADPDSGEGVVYVQDIDEAPTVDAVYVVRCKDCIHWDSETGWCNQNSAFDDHDMDWNIYNDDDFCSFGERKLND